MNRRSLIQGALGLLGLGALRKKAEAAPEVRAPEVSAPLPAAAETTNDINRFNYTVHSGTFHGIPVYSDPNLPNDGRIYFVPRHVDVRFPNMGSGAFAGMISDLGPLEKRFP